MDPGGQPLLGSGIYTVPEAANLTGVSTGRIRRWLKGYRYKSHKRRYASPALWRGGLDPIEDSLALSFLDLIEVRFVDAFLERGVSWAILRRARQRAQELFSDSHPFCSNRFATDGHAIFAELHDETGESSLVDIARDQKVFGHIVTPFFKELEFSKDDVLLRWRPLGEGHPVVLDPRRSFGQPIVDDEGVPTRILASALKATGSMVEVVRWFEIKESAVRAALEFERKLLAA